MHMKFRIIVRSRGEGLATQIFLKTKQSSLPFLLESKEKEKKKRKRKREKEISKKKKKEIRKKEKERQ